MVDWSLARQIARLAAGSAGSSTTALDLAAQVDDALVAVTGYTGLALSGQAPTPEVVDRAGWAEINLESLPHQTFTHNVVEGRKQKLAIEEVSQSDLKISPIGLSAKAGGELPTQTDAAGLERPLSASYQARVPLNSPDGHLLAGLRGQAKIKVGSQPLGAKLYRWVAQTINFKL